MNRRLIVREAAEHDLAEAVEWYEEQRPGLGRDFLADIDHAFQEILERPLTFPEVEQRVRRAMARRFPYGIYFVSTDVIVSVLAVLHGSRDPKHWRARI